jgi:hypothetical protein
MGIACHQAEEIFSIISIITKKNMLQSTQYPTNHAPVPTKISAYLAKASMQGILFIPVLGHEMGDQ